MSRQPTPNRSAVERLLAAAPDRAFSTQQVADAIGISRKEAAQHLGNIAFQKKARNTGTHGAAAYQWGSGAPSTIHTRPADPATAYRGPGAAAAAARPGCLRAFTLPSLVNGKPVERVAPRAMSSSVSEGRKS